MRKCGLEKLIFESKRDWEKIISNLTEELVQKGGKNFVGCIAK